MQQLSAEVRGGQRGAGSYKPFPVTLSIPPDQCCKSRQVVGEGTPNKHIYLCPSVLQVLAAQVSQRGIFKLESEHRPLLFVRLAVDDAMGPAR